MYVTVPIKLYCNLQYSFIRRKTLSYDSHCLTGEVTAMIRPDVFPGHPPCPES